MKYLPLCGQFLYQFAFKRVCGKTSQFLKNQVSPVFKNLRAAASPPPSQFAFHRKQIGVKRPNDGQAPKRMSLRRASAQASSHYGGQAPKRQVIRGMP
jgi:hypothetical protein